MREREREREQARERERERERGGREGGRDDVSYRCLQVGQASWVGGREGKERMKGLN